MNRARWIFSAATLFVLWLIGALLVLPGLERDLVAAAKEVLAQQPPLLNRLGKLELKFNGLEAHLTGSVRMPQDRSAVENAVKDLVRAPAPLTAGLARHLNPVGSVHNALEVVPYPPGWLLLAADGTHARLIGTTANDYEARDLALGVQESWSASGGVSEGLPEANAEHHDEAASVFATLRGVPTPQATAQAFLARIGQPWQDLPLQKFDAELLPQALASGVSEEEWQARVLPVLHDLRDKFEKQKSAQAEAKRLSRLPPGHLFLAVRDEQVILRGEVGTAAMKQAILSDALSTFFPRRIHDEIRVSAERRPTGDFGPITTALLPEEKQTGGKSMFLCLSGDAWKPVDWQITPAEQSWKKELPSGMKADVLQNDSAMLSGWLDGDATKAPPPSQRIEPAFITLALFGSKAVLSGQVAEEAVREQLLAAVRQAYSPPYLVISDDVHVSGDCEPSSGILQTLTSLPPPPKGQSAACFAIARPGGSWTLLPVTKELVEAGGLAKTGLLPAGLPAVVVENFSAGAIEQLRMHLAPPASR